jgi:hypothetical protein
LIYETNGYVHRKGKEYKIQTIVVVQAPKIIVIDEITNNIEKACQKYWPIEHKKCNKICIENAHAKH